MMSIANRTPFRQMRRAYSSLIKISDATTNFHEAQHQSIQRGVAGIEAAIVSMEKAFLLEIKSRQKAEDGLKVELHDQMGLLLLLDKSSLVDRCRCRSPVR